MWGVGGLVIHDEERDDDVLECEKEIFAICGEGELIAK